MNDPVKMEGSRKQDRFVSYAQNYEDVVLWRALRDVTPGTYVDVGAADPVVDSVTRALYERGWRGINIEPVPVYASALRADRPDDVVVECGVGAAAGTATLTVFDGTGWSTFDAHASAHARSRTDEVHELVVPMRTLDDVLSEHLEPGDTIHVLKIDVEGLEADVIAGARLDRWRPWVLVVEATEPTTTRSTHETWEPMVEAAGYEFCMFDGLNRFYVHQEHRSLEPLLSYPACPLDEPFEQRHDVELRRQLATSQSEVERRERLVRTMRLDLDALAAEHHALATEHRALSAARDALAAEHHALAAAHAVVREHADQLAAAYEGVLSSFSWRVTAPLRTLQQWRRRGHEPTPEPPAAVPEVSVEVAEVAEQLPDDDSTVARTDALHRRLLQGAALLNGRPGHVSDDAVDPFSHFVDALESSGVPSFRGAWLSYVVATATYPDEESVRSEDRLLRRVGPHGYIDRLSELFADAVDRGQASPIELDLIVDGVVVDVSHTAQHDLQTGIQRVVRETCSRWLADGRMTPVWWDYASNVLRRLGPDDVDRLRYWREHLPTQHGTEMTVHALDDGPSAIVVPWQSWLIVPELAAEPARTEGYRALALSNVIQGLSLIGYDLIPATAAETVTESMSHRFNLYLAMVKRASRLAAISAAAASDFSAFNAALGSQGLSGPVVEAHLLPPSPAPVDAEALASVRERLGLGDRPMVLVVGSHEPRKNHLTVLEAAEDLWSSGIDFDLVFIGGSGWRSEAFDREIERLQALERTVQVRRRASETELWAAYQLARFSVFPSLLEGYGLPIVESIASGTPVITTNYGSMAEVGVGGGAILVDPYDPAELGEAMRLLLHDDAVLDRLRDEAAAREFPTWDDYADEVWRFLVD